MGLANGISLLSGVSLFLFGMLLMGNGLKSVAGNKLEIVLYRLSNTPLKGVLLGTGVTAVIQSSSATSIMVVGFVNSGMMKVRQAIGIILGAIFGTSVTGWIICLSEVGGESSSFLELLSTATLTGVISVIGIIFRMFSKRRSYQQLGNILMGFAVLMTGMSAMSTAVAPLRESEVFIHILTTFSNPLIGILAGMLITCVLQSASATIGILQALSITGVITGEIAFPIVMGIAIGAAVPVLLSALGASINGKRTAFVYLFIDVIGVIVIGSVFYAVNAFVHFGFMTMTMNMISISLINTLFRLLTVIMLTPFIGLLEKLVVTIFKDSPDALEDTAPIDRLEERFLTHPSLAIEQSMEAVSSMALKARKNLARSFMLMNCYSDTLYDQIQEKESVIDRYEDKLGTYLVKLTGTELTHEQSQRISLFLHTIGDIERIGDHAVNLSNVAKEIHEKNLSFSTLAQTELNTLSSAVSEIVVLTTDAFIKNDLEGASQIEPLEEVIDTLCDEIKIRHVIRVQSGDCTLSHGFVFNDLLTNYERISDHCSNIAVAMIELNHDLFDTHEYLNKLKAEKNMAFEKHYEEFAKRYSLE